MMDGSFANGSRTVSASPMERPFAVTLFRDYAAADKREETYTLGSLASRVVNTTAPRKDLLPWLKLARFGEIRTDKASLRHDGNVLAISGIEADYDGEEVSFEAAVEIATKADLLCLLYTSPSHSPTKPRWRVLCPTSEELPPGERSKLLGRLNGAFQGIFSGESWTLSQAYYFGSVASNPDHRVEVLDGTFIDRLDELDETWRGKPNTQAASTPDGKPRQGPLNEPALLEEIRSGADYHAASLRLLGRWARNGVPFMEARQRLIDAMQCVFPPDRDGRWEMRFKDIDRCLDDIYGKEAAAKDRGERPARDDDHLGGSRKPGSRDRSTPARPALLLIDPRQWVAPPPPREWIVPDWVPRGVVTGLYGDGAVGKSLIAMQLLSAMALGQPWFGQTVAPGRALGVFCEDDETELQRRQWAINRSFGTGPGQLDNLRYLARLGHDNALITFDGSDVGTPTPFADELDSLCGEVRPDLLVLDTIADLFPANENDRAKVRQFVQTILGGLARRHGCAVLALGHPSVTGMANGSGQSGSTAWNNTFRSRFYLTREEGDEADPNGRLLSRKKANYAARDAEIRLQWHDGAFRVAGAIQMRASASDISWEQIGKIFDEIDRAWKAGQPWSHRPEVRKNGRMLQVWAKQHLGIPEKRLAALLADWLMNDFLAFEMYDKQSRSRGLRMVKRLDAEASA